MKQHWILITGGAGYIGSHIAHYFSSNNCNIIILDKTTPLFNHSWALFIHGDYGDKELLISLFTQYHISVVIHCAALIEINESVHKPLIYYENNVAKIISLLTVMQLYQCNQLIFSSSCAVYGIPQGPLTEEHPCNPITPYGRTKYYGEQILKDFAQSYPSFKYVSLRYFNAAGALPQYMLGERHSPETHCIPLLLSAAYHHKPFTIFGNDYATPDGTCIRDYIHVIDLASAHYRAFEYLHNGNDSAIFNIGTGHGYSVQELITLAQQIINTPISVQYGPRRPGDPAYLIAQADKAMKQLPWQPQKSDIYDIVKSAYDFFMLKTLTLL